VKILRILMKKLLLALSSAGRCAALQVREIFKLLLALCVEFEDR